MSSVQTASRSGMMQSIDEHDVIIASTLQQCREQRVLTAFGESLCAWC